MPGFSSKSPFVFFVSFVAILPSPPSRADQPAVELTAAANVSAIQPAKPFEIAITIKPPPNWHIYWKNPGDSGLPTRVKWTLPPGFSASDLQFPIPHQFTLPGPILAYGYEGPTTFLTTITPPATLKPGDTATIKATASWLCCKEECVPGQAKFQIPLPISTQATPANDPVFKAAEFHMPADSPPSDVGQIHIESRKTPAGQAFLLKTSQPGLRLQMFPVPPPALIITDIRPGDSQIEFNARVLDGQKLETSQLPVLITWYKPGPPDMDHPAGFHYRVHAFYMNIDLTSLSSADSH